MDKAVVLLSFYLDNSEIFSTICFICGHFPCITGIRHRLAADRWRMRTSVMMRWHKWHNSNKPFENTHQIGDIVLHKTID